MSMTEKHDKVYNDYPDAFSTLNCAVLYIMINIRSVATSKTQRNKLNAVEFFTYMYGYMQGKPQLGAKLW